MSEFFPATQSQFRVIEHGANTLLDIVGVKVIDHAADNPTAMKIHKAIIPLDRPSFTRATNKTTIPVLRLSKLLQTEMANWRYEFDYGMQDEETSRKAIISEVPATGFYAFVEGFFPGHASVLDTEGAEKIIEDLDKLQSIMKIMN